LSLVTCHLSPFTIHHSPLTRHLSLVPIHPSPVTIHHSPFTRLTLSVQIDSATGERVRAYACRLIPRCLPCAYTSGIHRGRAPENTAPNPFGASYSALVPPNSSGALCMLDLPPHLLPQFHLWPEFIRRPLYGIMRAERGAVGSGEKKAAASSSGRPTRFRILGGRDQNVSLL
jgi:hypothetical protein